MAILVYATTRSQRTPSLLPVHTSGPLPPAGRRGLTARPPFRSRALALPWRYGAALADANRLHAVLAHGLDPNREAVGVDRVPAPGQAPELGEHEASDRVIRVAVHRQIQAVVGQVGAGDVPPHEPVAVGEPADLARRGVGLIGDLPDDLLDDV